MAQTATSDRLLSESIKEILAEAAEKNPSRPIDAGEFLRSALNYGRRNAHNAAQDLISAVSKHVVPSSLEEF